MDVVAFFQRIFTSCTGWFDTLLSATNMAQWLLAAVGVIMSIRFLLLPIFGGIFNISTAGSDSAKKGKFDSGKYSVSSNPGYHGKYEK